MNSDILEAFKEYLAIIKALDTQSVKFYITDLKQLQDFIKKDLTSLKTDDILKFLSTFPNKRTLNRKLASINAFFSFCHKYEFNNTKIKIPMAKIGKDLPKYMSKDEIISAISLIDRDKISGLRDYALILFLYASGARVSEALNTKRMDITEGWLKIRFAKGDKQRIVPIAPKALEAIELYLKRQYLSSEYIFLNNRGTKLSRISAYKIVKKYLGVSPHILRHSFATSLIIGGADLKVVQELLGHASLETTQIYTHIQKHNLEETLNKYHPLSEV